MECDRDDENDHDCDLADISAELSMLSVNVHIFQSGFISDNAGVRKAIQHARENKSCTFQ